MNEDQLRANVEYLDACLRDIHTRNEGQPLSDEDQTAFDAGLALRNEQRDTLTSIEDRNRAIELMEATTVRTENGDGARAAENHTRSRTTDIYDLSSMRSANRTSPEYGSELRDRALQAIDSWGDDHGVPEAFQEQARSHVTGAARGGSAAKVAEHIVRYGNPGYVDAFFAYIRGGDTLLTDSQRSYAAEANRAAANEGTTTQGGFLVPPMLDPTIILTNNGVTNPFRAVSTIKTITTQTWKGVTSAGVTAEWTAEAQEVADATPTFAQPTITPIRADAYMQASREMLEDTGIATDVAMLFADAKDRLEATAFAVGSGSTQPKGVITAVSAVTASRVAGSSGAAGAADFVLADVYALANALPPRHRPNSSWMGEQTTLNKIRRFGEGTTSNAAFWADLGVGIPSQLLGRPVYESSEMDNTIVSGSNDDVLLIGDFKKFYIVDRIGLEVVFNPLVIGSSRRPTGEVGWACFWRVGSDVVDANAFRLLRV